MISGKAFLILFLSLPLILTQDVDKKGKPVIFPGDPGIITPPRDIKKDVETVCEAFNANADGMKTNLTQRMEYEDMLRFMTWSLKYDLKSGKTPLKFDAALDWKREIIDLHAQIFKKGCPSEYVSEGFINIAKELSLVYQNSIENPTTDTKDMWMKTLSILKMCPEKIDALKFRSHGFEAASLILKDEKGDDGFIDVRPPTELVDGIHSIDAIVDTMWWMFSFSFASCYPLMENKSVALAQYKKLFYNDFLIDLKKRWKHGGRWTMSYGPIFGDIDIVTALRNTRFCVTAAYVKSSIDDRELVRPLGAPEHGPSDQDMSEMSNRKVM